MKTKGANNFQSVVYCEVSQVPRRPLIEVLKYRHFGMLILYTTQCYSTTTGRLLQQPCIASIWFAPKASGVSAVLVY